ncbi:MAG: alpha/beta fold hydrolase [Saprospiraceae bacterium]
MRKLIDREIFFGNPEISGGKLSPDGQYVSFVKAYKGIMNIYVKSFGQSFDKARLITQSTTPLLGYFWTADSKYILYLNDKAGDENVNIFSVNPIEQTSGVPESNNITPLTDVTVQIYKVSRKNPDLLWVGINDRDKAWHDLYLLNIKSKKLEMIYENNERITGWGFDWDEEIRIAYRSNENGHSEILKVSNLSNFELIYTTNLQENAGITGWNEDNTAAYLISNKGKEDLTTLYLLNFENLDISIIENDPLGKVDIGSVFINRHTRKIICTSYVDDKVRRYWKDKEWESMFSFLEKQFPNRDVSITSTTDDYRKMLIAVSGDQYAVELFYFDWDTMTLIPQYIPKPKLRAVQDRLSPMVPITYPSSDGLMIPAYLTIPKSTETNENLPCVIMVHGGPKGPRDNWGYNGAVQFLADRGYAVLQPNFRASGGYGKSFLNAGDKQWGRLMQDDITWGVKYLTDNNIADANKIAIMGGSYGGYATLAGLAFTPDVYACGVDIVGPSNLFTLLESIPPYWEAGRKWLYEMTGDPETKEGKNLIKNASPLFSAHKISKPLMIVQGANDPRVKKAESDQIVEALQKNSQPVSYLLALDEGHGFRKPLNRLAMYAEIERFFAEHLGGEYQESMSDEVKNTLESLKV